MEFAVRCDEGVNGGDENGEAVGEEGVKGEGVEGEGVRGVRGLLESLGREVVGILS